MNSKLEHQRFSKLLPGRFGRMSAAFVGMLLISTLIAAPIQQAAACPFCSAVTQTFSQEFKSTDLVVVAKLIKQAPNMSGGEAKASDVTKAVFKVEEILKGKELIETDLEIEAVYFGDAELGDAFLLTGMEPPRPLWSSPIRVTERELDYLKKLPSLPESGAERLKFFMAHLEDESTMLSQDAYDEFALAPYAEVIELKDAMNHDELVEWITDEDVTASRKRLYLTMLGVCGQPSDLELLEKLMTSSDRRQRSGLDAMIACYLTLKGEEGLDLIEKQFLANQDADYADTYAAILAIRFHGTEGNLIEKSRLVKSLELLLDRPKVADLVIPDLARWQDWDVMDKLVKMFKEADDSTNWVRVPVVNYLRLCPRPEAKDHLKELEKIDPDSVKRAKTFFPLLDQQDDADSDDDDSDDGDAANSGGTDDGEPLRSEDANTAGDVSNYESSEPSLLNDDTHPVPEPNLADSISRGPAISSTLAVLANEGESLSDKNFDDQISTTRVRARKPRVDDKVASSEFVNVVSTISSKVPSLLTNTVEPATYPTAKHLVNKTTAELPKDANSEAMTEEDLPVANASANAQPSTSAEQTQFITQTLPAQEPNADQSRNESSEVAASSEASLVAQTGMGRAPSILMVLTMTFLTSVMLLLLIWGLLTGRVIGLLS